VKLGQDVTSAEIKKEKADLKIEREKYDKFLVRDKERLGYANDMCSTRQMVLQSYKNEMNRQQKSLVETALKEKEIQESINNLKNMERIDTATNVSKKRTKSKDLKKSKTKPAPQEHVKSHLLQSIESSRQKSNQKYNPNRVRNIANKENEDSKSIQ
jgi:septal ring factor EnvC (AmiA/AmiB activator)